MDTVADTSEWVEDAALGVAVREVEGELQVLAISQDGASRCYAAILAAYVGNTGPILAVIEERGGTAYRIDPAHRLAFARALWPIECEVKAVQA